MLNKEFNRASKETAQLPNIEKEYSPLPPIGGPINYNQSPSLMRLHHPEDLISVQSQGKVTFGKVRQTSPRT
jgi:hypothetical protein